jgi:hypothetical protein
MNAVKEYDHSSLYELISFCIEILTLFEDLAYKHRYFRNIRSECHPITNTLPQKLGNQYTRPKLICPDCWGFGLGLKYPELIVKCMDCDKILENVFYGM